jgi:hypothetical protein
VTTKTATVATKATTAVTTKRESAGNRHAGKRDRGDGGDEHFTKH